MSNRPMEENRSYRITHVYNVDDTLVVADTMEEAIGLYREYYSDGEPRNVKQLYCGNSTYSDSWNALIKRK